MTSVKPEYEKFESPKAIVESSTLTVDEKYSLLTQWREDEEALIRSASEGLEGGEANNLKGVQKALETLKKVNPKAVHENLKQSLEKAEFETMAHQAKAALGADS